jgi:carotenoid cleavage dioxygenase
MMFDHASRSVRYAFAGPAATVEEMTFIPRRPDAPEGDGYLVGMTHLPLENRSELLLFDTQGLEDGPIARVKLPYRVFGQIHGWWTDASTIPGWDDAV